MKTILTVGVSLIAAVSVLVLFPQTVRAYEDNFIMGVRADGTPTVSVREFAVPTNMTLRITATTFGLMSNYVNHTITGLNFEHLDFVYERDGFVAQGRGVYPNRIFGPSRFTMRFVQLLGDRSLMLDNSGYEVTAAFEFTGPPYPPDRTAVVPAGAGAAIALESSHDLVNWQPAPLGSYQPTNNLFFRLRLDRL